MATFLGSEDMQEQARQGVIWVDEAGLLPIDDLDRLCSLAKSLDARIVLQGDPKQHRAVSRDGNMLEVLESFAGLPVAKLTEIKRQRGDYAKAVAAIRDHRLEEADTVLRKLGWIVEGKGHDALVVEYAKAIEEKKPNGERKTVLVIDPTHKDGDGLAEKLRAVRKEKGLIAEEEKTFPRLVACDWTNAEKMDADHYGGEETVQFFKNTGKFRAGDRVRATEVLPHLPRLNPKHFQVFNKTEVRFSVGDIVKTTNGGWDVTGKHRIDNNRFDVIKGFTKDDGIILSNGWELGKNFAHIKHGLVRTSMATQSKTEDIVLAAMNKASLGATNHAQGYVTASRGRERGMIFTDLSRDELLRAVARGDGRKSATELFRPKQEPARTAKATDRMRAFMEKVRSTYRQLQRKAAAVANERFGNREMGYAR